MRLITIISTLCMVFPLALSGAPNSTEKKSPVDYVNPYMGNISHLLIPTLLCTCQIPCCVFVLKEVILHQI